MRPVESSLYSAFHFLHSRHTAPEKWAAGFLDSTSNVLFPASEMLLLPQILCGTSLLLCTISPQPWVGEGRRWPSPGPPALSSAPGLQHCPRLYLDTDGLPPSECSIFPHPFFPLIPIVQGSLMPPATKMHHLLASHTSYMKLRPQQHSRLEGHAPGRPGFRGRSGTPNDTHLRR